MQLDYNKLQQNTKFGQKGKFKFQKKQKLKKVFFQL